jgi:hypothetical protein
VSEASLGNCLWLLSDPGAGSAGRQFSLCLRVAFYYYMEGGARAVCAKKVGV